MAIRYTYSMSESDVSAEKMVNFTVPTIGEKGVVKPLVSPLSMGDLVQGEDGLYFGKSEGRKYMVNEGKIIPLVDPMSGGDLIRGKEGKFVSESTGGKFELYKDYFIPLYVPDKTLEPAHIENGRLVGNETGRSFEINEEGVVLTPDERENKSMAEMDLVKLKTALKEAEDEVNKSILENMAGLGRSLWDVMKKSFQEGETDEQLRQKIKGLIEEYDGRSKAMADRYYFKLENITQVLKPKTEPNLEAELESEQEQGLESELEPKPKLESKTDEV